MTTKLLLLISTLFSLQVFAIGGQDGGGAEAITSTREQVLEAITRAYEIGARKDTYSNIFMRFWVSHTGGEFNPGETFDPTPLFPNAQISDFPEIDASSPALDAVLKNPPELLETESCPQSTREVAIASASSYDLNGKICFSISELMKLHPAVLFGDILGTILHEALHLAGIRDEAVAEEWQKAFGVYFRWRFQWLEGQHVRERTATHLEIAQQYLDFAIDTNRNKPGDPLVFAIVGAVARLLISLPYLFDPIALEFAVRPKNPDLANNYSNTLLATYIYGERAISDKGRYYAAKPKELDVLLNTINVNLAKVKRAFAAYAVGADPTERNRGSHCVLRSHEPRINLRLESDMNRLHQHGLNPSLLLPPKVCAAGTARESVDAIGKAIPTGRPRQKHRAALRR